MTDTPKAAVLCIDCQQPMHDTVNDGHLCINPRCTKSGILTETANARIVIEWTKGFGVTASWWRDDSIAVYLQLGLIRHMLLSAWGIIRAQLVPLVQKVASWN